MKMLSLFSLLILLIGYPYLEAKGAESWNMGFENSFFVNVTRGAKAEILLSSKSCDILKAEVGSLISSLQLSVSKPTCLCVNKKCSVNIYPYLPILLTKMEGVNTVVHGPNCFNAVLVVAGILKHFRESSEAEIKYWLGSRLCRKLLPGEVLHYGDIIRILHADGSDIHTYTYLSRNLGFSKNGRGRQAPYKIQTHREIFDVYNAPYASVDENSDLTIQVKKYRCNSFERQLTFEQADPQLSVFLKHFSKLENIERDLESLLFYPSEKQNYRAERLALLGRSKEFVSLFVPPKFNEMYADFGPHMDLWIALDFMSGSIFSALSNESYLED